MLFFPAHSPSSEEVLPLAFCQASTEFSPQATPEFDDDEDYHEMLQYRYGGLVDAEDVDEYYEDLARRTRGSRQRAVGNRVFGSGGVMATGRRAARATPNVGSSRGEADETVRHQWVLAYPESILQ